MCADNVDIRIEEYLACLQKNLSKLPNAERDELIEEMRCHILERIADEDQVSGDVVSRVLTAVGEPKQLASQYETEYMLRQAARSRSPLVLLGSTLKWGTKGITGFVAFAVTLAGYGCAAVGYLCALLKPILPERIGLWLSPEHTLTLGFWNGRLSGTEVYGISVRPPISFVLGTQSATNGPVREISGPWFFPVSLMVGLLFVVGTTYFTRWYIKRFGWRTSAPALLVYPSLKMR